MRKKKSITKPLDERLAKARGVVPVTIKGGKKELRGCGLSVALLPMHERVASEGTRAGSTDTTEGKISDCAVWNGHQQAPEEENINTWEGHKERRKTKENTIPGNS